MHRAQFPYRLVYRSAVTPDAPVVARFTRIGDCDIDRFLVHIHANKRGARLNHGLPPRTVVDAHVLNMWPCALTRVTHDTLEAGRLFALSHSV
jgi:hypothetical protein